MSKPSCWVAFVPWNRLSLICAVVRDTLSRLNSDSCWGLQHEYLISSRSHWYGRMDVF